MKRRYVLAPDAALDLAHIWRYIKQQSGEAIATRIESEIRHKIVFLARCPGAGHLRKDLTEAPVRWFPVYSYLIVYRPDTQPLQVVSIPLPQNNYRRDPPRPGEMEPCPTPPEDPRNPREYPP